MIKRMFLYTMTTFLSCHLCFAQSPEVVRTINHYQEQITDYNNHYTDALDGTNTKLMTYLKKVLLQIDPVSANWNKLNKSVIQIVTSDDKKLRIFFWDTRTDGSARTINVVAQYSSAGKTKLLVLNDADKQDERTVCSGGAYADISTFHTDKGQTVYLVKGTTICSSALGLTRIEAFTIDQSLHAVPFFKTTKTVLSKIEYTYDLSVPANRDKDVPEIQYKDQKKKLLIPVVQADDIITRHFLVYQYNGNQFVYIKKE